MNRPTEPKNQLECAFTGVAYKHAQNQTFERRIEPKSSDCVSRAEITRDIEKEIEESESHGTPL
jgi:hypothetical protein